MSVPFAIIAGVGPGTGAAVARKFSTAYPVALLARNPANYEDTVRDIQASGGKAIGISTDVSDSKSVSDAVTKTQQAFGSTCAAAVFNVGGKFVRKPFLDLSLEEFESGWEANGRGAFLFSHSILPLLLNSTKQSTPPPTLIFTGATASLKGSAQFAAFSTGKFAKRSLAQSLAREFGPKGVHVAHVNIDGVIDIERTKEWMKDAGEDAKIKPEAIADAYWHLHTQPRTCFTQEMDKPANANIGTTEKETPRANEGFESGSPKDRWVDMIPATPQRMHTARPNSCGGVAELVR